MHKAARLAFQKGLAPFNAQALEVHKLVCAELAEHHGIAESAYVHQADIAVAVVGSIPNLVADVALLTEMGELSAAARAVTGAVHAVKETDPALFMPAPSPKLATAIQLGLDCQDAEAYVRTISSNSYVTGDALRKLVLPLRRAAIAAGRPLLCEADVAGKPDRTEARAAEYRAGRGVSASKRLGVA